MTRADIQLAALRDALAELAAQDVDEVLADARADARAQVRQALTEAMTRSLTEAIERQLRPSADPQRRQRAPRPSEGVVPGQRARQQHSPPTPAPEKPGIYAYGVVWATDAPFTEGMSGFDADDLVSSVIEGPVAAVISRVQLSEFEEDELRAHLSDLEWVERIARGHEAVLDDLCTRTVVVPMRMCSVYRSEENLRSMLRREESNLRSALEFLDGKIEWGVKVVAGGESQGEGTPDATAAADDARAASSGADYMARRRARRDEQAETESLHTEAVAEIHESLGGLAHDGQLNPIGSSELPGQAGRVVMNGVYLVERENAEAFHRLVWSLEQRFAGLDLELLESGPWPPYNFVPGDVGATW